MGIGGIRALSAIACIAIGLLVGAVVATVVPVDVATEQDVATSSNDALTSDEALIQLKTLMWLKTPM